jgi:hypothetical protein
MKNVLKKEEKRRQRREAVMVVVKKKSQGKYYRFPFPFPPTIPTHIFYFFFATFFFISTYIILSFLIKKFIKSLCKFLLSLNVHRQRVVELAMIMRKYCAQS